MTGTDTDTKPDRIARPVRPPKPPKYKIRQHNLTPRPRGQQEPVGAILKADSQN